MKKLMPFITLLGVYSLTAALASTAFAQGNPPGDPPDNPSAGLASETP